MLVNLITHASLFFYPEKSIWRTILSQSIILNIFPASVSLAHVRKILESISIRKTKKYIPQLALWISRPFIELANRNNRVFLTLDCSGINKDEPGRFRTKANKLDFQTCYFNVANDKESYNEFVSQHIYKNEINDRIQFKITHLKSKTNSEETFDATEELHNFNKNNGTGTYGDSKKKVRTIFETNSEMQNPLNKLVQGLEHELELSQNFFLGNNVNCGQQQQQQ